MSKSPDREERSRLQYEAERTQPPRHSLVIYLVILVAAAFLLLMVAYLQQQRTNREALDSLQQTSNSAVESVGNLLAENESLRTQVADLEGRLAGLQPQLDAAQKALEEAQSGKTEALERQEALTAYALLEYCYRTQLYDEAASRLADIRDTEGLVERIAAAMDGAEHPISLPADISARLDEIAQVLEEKGFLLNGRPFRG